MLDNNFGENLSSKEKQFINQYCNFLEKYGSVSFFPISKELKLQQYDMLMQIVNKLTPEEVVKFNEIIDRCQTLHLGDNLENGDRIR